MLINHGFENEAIEYENLAILVLMGLPNLKAIKLYFSGITSRLAATELSIFFTSKEIETNTNELINLIIAKSNVIRPFVTDISKSWLSILESKVRESNSKKLIELPKLESLEFTSKTLNFKRYNQKYYNYIPLVMVLI